MVQKNNYTLTELENLVPFERDLYVDLALAMNKKRKSSDNVVVDNTGVDFGE